MNAPLRAPIALGFLLSISLFAAPVPADPARHAGHTSPHHRVADFAAAKALVSPAPPAPPERETDGLSRNREDCSSTGCIDSGGS